MSFFLASLLNGHTINISNMVFYLQYTPNLINVYSTAVALRNRYLCFTLPYLARAFAKN